MKLMIASIWNTYSPLEWLWVFLIKMQRIHCPKTIYIHGIKPVCKYIHVHIFKFVRKISPSAIEKVLPVLCLPIMIQSLTQSFFWILPVAHLNWLFLTWTVIESSIAWPFHPKIKTQESIENEMLLSKDLNSVHAFLLIFSIKCHLSE